MKNLFCKNPLVTIFVAFVIIIVANIRPASAAHWVVTYKTTAGTAVMQVQHAATVTDPTPPTKPIFTKGQNGTTLAPNYGTSTPVMNATVGAMLPWPYNGNLIVGAASANINLPFDVIFTWTPEVGEDPTPPPNILVFTEGAHANISASPPYSHGGGYQWDAIGALSADNGIGSEHQSEQDSSSRYINCIGSRIYAIKTGGKTSIKISRNLKASGELHPYNVYMSGSDWNAGYLYPLVGYGAGIDNFFISASVNKGSLISSTSTLDNQSWHGYLKQDYHLNDPGQALDPFWSGVASIGVTATTPGGQPLFGNSTQYTWTVSGGTPYIPEPHGDAEAWIYLPDATLYNGQNVQNKELHLDFGHLEPGDTPSPTNVKVQVTGTNAGDPVLTGKVGITWHLPRWYVTKPTDPNNPGTPVIVVIGESDPDKPTGPVDPADEPDAAEMETIEQYIQARQQFLQTGEELVGDALRAEEAIGEFYVTGPLYELGAGALGAVIGKAGEALDKVRELRAFAAKAAEEAATARRLAQEGKTAGKSAEEVTQAEELATQLDQKATKAKNKADSLEQKADQALQEAKAAQELPGKFSENDMALGVHENLPTFKGNAKIGTDMYAQYPNLELFQGICKGMDDTVAAGGKLRFDLDGVNVQAALDATSTELVPGSTTRIYDTITSQELRYVLQNHAGDTIFYENGVITTAP